MNNRIKKLLILFLICGNSAFSADIGNVKVTSSISPSTIKIGERIDLHVTVEHENGIDVFYPDESARFAPFELLSHNATTRKSGFGRTSTEIVYSITAFDEGEFKVPPVLVTAKDRFGNERNIRTVEHKIKVMLGAETGSEIVDILPPMDMTEKAQYLKKALSYLQYIIPVLSIAAVLIFLYLTRRKPEVVTVDARMRAIERLRLLRIEEAGITALYFEISEILRAFLHEHMKIDALKMTSGELLSNIRRFDNDTLSGDAAELFYDLDLVKFSPFLPSPEDAEVAVIRAKRMIRGVP